MPQANPQSTQPGAVPPPNPSQLGNDDAMHPLLQKIVDNIKIIAAVVAAVILVVAAWGVYGSMQEKALRDASNTLGTIKLQKKGMAEFKALEEFYPEAPAELKNAVLFEMAEAAYTAEEYDKAAEVWATLAERLEGVDATLAKLGRAKSLNAAGRGSEALVVLQALAASAPKSFMNEVMRSLAAVAEQMGDTEVALQGYRYLIDNANLQDKTYFAHKVAQLEKAE